jgi:hypothetical protein
MEKQDLFVTFQDLFKRFLAKIEYGDFPLFVFFLVTVRQYCWIIENNDIAWVLALMIALSLLYVHVSFKETLNWPVESSKILFTFLIAIPFLVIYLMRALIPDTFLDVMSYHIPVGDRAMIGFPYIASDFFPFGGTNPPSLSDMFTAVFRKTLGYRAGTMGNYLILLWTATIVEKFLRETVKKQGKRYLFVFLILSCEYVLFEINSYMVDLLGVPLLLEATWIIANFKNVRNKDYYLLYISLLFGLALALKLTNLVYIIPLVLWTAVQIRQTPIGVSFKTVVFCVALFFFPILPYSLPMYIETGNPIFPYYNKMFKSPYWPLAYISDPRWGPKSILEAVFWPILTILVPERASELKVYSGRIALAFVLSLLGLVWTEKRTQVLIVLWLLGSLLWSQFGIGYMRYGLYSEILGGIVIVHVIVHRKCQGGLLSARGIGITFLVLLAVQCTFAYKYVCTFEWCMRPTIFQSPRLHIENLRYIFRDRSLSRFLSDHDRKVVEGAEAWAVGWIDAGYMSMLKNDIPIIRLESCAYFNTPKGLEKFRLTLKNLEEKRIISICPVENLQRCMSSINERGLSIRDVRAVTIPFFGYRDIPSYAFQLREGQGVEGSKYPGPFAQTSITHPLPIDAFKADIVVEEIPESVKANSYPFMRVNVRNASAFPWPALGTPQGEYSINLSYHLHKKDGTICHFDGIRSPLPFDLNPGMEFSFISLLQAPGTPGQYIVEFDMVQERVSWFKDRGSATASASLTVNP